MNRVREIVNCDYAHAKGFYGEGIGVAILDTGIAPHVDFINNTNRIKVFIDLVNRRKLPYDDCGHGTHVAGIIGGDGSDSKGKYRGIAPSCSFIIFKVLDSFGNGNVNNIIKAIDWIIKYRHNYNIKIINISVGAETSSDKSLKLLENYIEKAWNYGICVLLAAGNLGPSNGSVTCPGTNKKIITVGAYEEKLSKDTDSEIIYSGRGPTKEGIIKPEVVAPGYNIASCINGKRGYVYKSGTSMSTPVVSGAMALCYDKYPFLTNKEAKILLYNTCTKTNKPKNVHGWGLLNVKALLS
ncbi:MAG: S8 family peptidase [Lachnospiraceae bacterium]|nr:S8 family peptidase [Lachnospiraceae bacterium]